MLTRLMIQRAYVEIGQVDSTTAATGPEMTDGLSALNQLIWSMRGNGIGGRLKNTLVTADFSADTGRAYMVDANLGAITALLPASPQDGDRFGVSDSRKKFAVHHLTIDPNGQLIGDTTTTSAANLVVSATGDNRRYTFIAEMGWIREQNLALTDQSPYSNEVNEALIYMLAGRMAVSFGTPISPQLAQATADGWSAIVRRYGRKGRNQQIPPVGVVTPSKPQARA